MRSHQGLRGLIATLATAGLSLALAKPAHADQMVIKHPGMHPSYGFEAEPHLLVGPFDPPGDAKGGAFGPGFRGTIELVDNGFVSSINNTVGIGFGGDLLLGGKTAVWIPVVMQWNFWLSRNWSVFGEPGGGIYLGNAKGIRPAFYAGGRWHFADGMSLTLRLGHPNFTVGVSFLL